MANSLSKNKIEISDNECTAILYSTGDLTSYIIEIHDHGNVFMLLKNGKPETFKSLDLAKNATKKYSPDKRYIALDKTYEEFDTVNDFDGNAKGRSYDYLPI